MGEVGGGSGGFSSVCVCLCGFFRSLCLSGDVLRNIHSFGGFCD